MRIEFTFIIIHLFFRYVYRKAIFRVPYPTAAKLDLITTNPLSVCPSTGSLARTGIAIKLNFSQNVHICGRYSNKH